MKAVVVRRYGGPEVLELLDWPEPEVGASDVLIRVHAVTVGRTLDVGVRARGADFGAALPRAGGDGVCVVFENIASPELFGEALASLRPYGKLVTCGAHAGGVVPLPVRSLYRHHLTIVGDTAATAAQTREVFQRVAERRLDAPPVLHRFELEDVAAPHGAASSRELFGRAVLIVREEPQEAVDRA